MKMKLKLTNNHNAIEPSKYLKNMIGFTVVELMTALAVAAILTAVAIPGFKIILASSTRDSIATRLHSALRLARLEAIKRNSCVQVVPITQTVNGKTTTSYSNGWRLVDISNNSTIQTYPINTVYSSPPISTIKCTNTSVATACPSPPNTYSSNAAITFTPSGKINSNLANCGQSLEDGFYYGLFGINPKGCRSAVWVAVDNLSNASIQPAEKTLTCP